MTKKPPVLDAFYNLWRSLDEEGLCTPSNPVIIQVPKETFKALTWEFGRYYRPEVADPVYPIDGKLRLGDLHITSW